VIFDKPDAISRVKVLTITRTGKM